MSSRSIPRFGAAAGAVIVVAVISAAALAGCTTQSPPPAPSIGPSVLPTATPGSTSTPSPIPTFDPSGSAEDNLAYFNQVGFGLLTHDPSANGRTIVDWFVSHGFDKANMQVTPDKTSIGLQAWNIEFSVELNGTCLIGQAGNVGFHSYAGPLLATGKCRIGATRKIDW